MDDAFDGTDRGARDLDLAADLRWLGRVAARLVRDPGLRDDACQEAWLGVRRPAPTRAELANALRRFLYRHWRSDGQQWWSIKPILGQHH